MIRKRWWKPHTPEQLEKQRKYQREWHNRDRAEHLEERRKKDRLSYRDNPKKKEKNFRQNLKKRGLSIEVYAVILKSQNHSCAICGLNEQENGKRLAVDHSHKTGKIRALLCNRCNTILGLADDNIEILSRLITYLRQHET